MRTIIWVSLSASVLAAQAQTWCPPAAVWHYAYSSVSGAVGFVRMENIGDTVILGQPCSILAKRRIGYDYVNQQSFDQTIGQEFTYAENGIVWLYVTATTAFDTLFDLNADPGDSWRLAERPNSSICDSLSAMTVLDTGTRLVDGLPLKWMAVAVSYHPENAESFTDTIVERIGPTGSYLLPFDVCNWSLDVQEGGPFRCYQDGEVDYSAPQVLSCEAPLYVQHLSRTPSVLVVPNPSTGPFTILAAGIRRLMLFDPTGALVLDRALNAASHAVIDPGSFPSGPYQARVLLADGWSNIMLIKE